MAASQSSGSKVMSLQGRLYRERERLTGMTEEERCWRAKWVRDQRLAPNEPLIQPKYEQDKILYHGLRKFYQYPFNQFAKALVPRIGLKNAYTLRYLITCSFIGLSYFYFAMYYIKYNHNDWTRKGGWRVVLNRPAVYDGIDPALYERKNPSDYANRGFKSSPI